MYQIWLFLFKEAKKEARVISLAIDYNFEKLLTQAVFDFLEKRNRNAKKMTNSYMIPSGVRQLFPFFPSGLRMA